MHSQVKSELGKLVVRQWCEAGRSAGCTALAVARLRAATGIIGMRALEGNDRILEAHQITTLMSALRG